MSVSVLLALAAILLLGAVQPSWAVRFAASSGAHGERLIIGFEAGLPEYTLARTDDGFGLVLLFPQGVEQGEPTMRKAVVRGRLLSSLTPLPDGLLIRTTTRNFNYAAQVDPATNQLQVVLSPRRLEAAQTLSESSAADIPPTTSNNTPGGRNCLLRLRPRRRRGSRRLGPQIVPCKHLVHRLRSQRLLKHLRRIRWRMCCALRCGKWVPMRPRSTLRRWPLRRYKLNPNRLRVIPVWCMGG